MAKVFPARVPARTLLFTLLALVAFAANSLLCRAALRDSMVDPASFTAVRLVSGAAVLWLLVVLRGGARAGQGNWPSAMALLAYAVAFSFAYVSVSIGTGALLLFGAVQTTMVGYGVWRGARLRGLQFGGFLLASAGLVGLLLPGLSAPPLHGAMLMLAAGIAWGVYSLRGQGTGDATCVTAGNFLRAAPVALLLGLGVTLYHGVAPDPAGVGYAIASGALASGIGYAIWYSVLPSLQATTAATVQLSVPLIAAMGGVVFLAEPVTTRLALASVAVLGGIALVILSGHMTRPAR